MVKVYINKCFPPQREVTPRGGGTMDEWEEYDDMDVESVILHGHDEDEDVDPDEAAFLRGYLGMGEA
jgi:hypothetical protein